MNIIANRSNLDWWNSILREFSRFADHKWLSLADYLISHHCKTDKGDRVTQVLIAKVSGVDPADLNKKLKDFQEGRND